MSAIIQIGLVKATGSAFIPAPVIITSHHLTIIVLFQLERYQEGSKEKSTFLTIKSNGLAVVSSAITAGLIFLVMRAIFFRIKFKILA